MKSSAIRYFVFLHLIYCTTTLAATIPPYSTALIHRLSHTTALLHNSTTPFSLDARPPDSTYYGFGHIRRPEGGFIKIDDYGPDLFFADYCEVGQYIVSDCEYHIPRDPDVHLGTDPRF
jgi:hypothetical protein